MALLLNNASATGEALSVGRSSEYVFSADGNFGGATVTLQIGSPDGTSWLSVEDGALTAEGSFVVFLGKGTLVRAAVSGGTPSGLYASLN